MALSCGKELACIMQRKTLENNGKFFCLNCLHSFRTKKKEHENVCKNHDYCNIEIPEKGKGILNYNH